MNYIEKLSEVLYRKYSRDINTLKIFNKLKDDLHDFNEKFELYFKASGNSSIHFDPKLSKCGDVNIEPFEKILVTIDDLERLIVCEIHTEHPGINVYDLDSGRPVLRMRADSAESVTILGFNSGKIQIDELLDIIIGNVFLIPSY
ncbi:hypothetical protein MOE50_05060 [Bacillus inaquosorum]|uniref:hypothetical protein n=1 Tax=Bacillus inaquosorum TaxID=483913 RepID=UPI00227E45AD|nr:hypothetical protein [Bacillus inaquosorum]MCY7751622.1 hypothetical protein [Bacillus inaquosorum]MCY9008371.1 hypothetical protein [Bacillus inaquosorum]MCY9038565.1 hypothetical protein [Bacillus inaquosorum]MCY9043813.1 hypothetical protein [Bacillus inaquosorum]